MILDRFPHGNRSFFVLLGREGRFARYGPTSSQESFKAGRRFEFGSVSARLPLPDLKRGWTSSGYGIFSNPVAGLRTES
jgi:hypothetical protein